ncbi:hypothetical protein LWI29_012826 [Acer saccharum]|uniref:non-specific serine/threonine protein kinase n=1 Tax=Acer saccharum TaxID=4024 RepID=A0AA39W113_ACESA|nr:hypothetical protein LWI29_012826 [Acer saccharum]
MSSSGYLLPSKWKDQNWERFSATEVDRCELYDVCGSYASCNINNPPDLCECLEGFTPKSPGHGTEGCVRRAPLQCNHSDGFQIHKEVKLPDTSHSRVDNNISLAECKEFCLNNCSCTAYANSDVREGRTGCLLWFGDLFDIKKLELNGQDLYVRVAASELANIDQPIARRRHLSEKKRAIILVSCVVSAVGVLVLGWVIFMGKRKLRIQGKTDNIRDVNNNSEVSETDDTELLIAGSWNVIRFTGALRLNPNPEFLYQFELNKDEQGSLMSRLFMSQPGLIQLLVRSNQSKVWTTVYDAPEDQCDIYSFCGAQAACKTDSSSSVCVCLDGFEPKSPEEWRMSNWSKGCVRMTELNCEKGDEFRNYTGLKLPDTSNSTFNTSMSLQECKEKCLKDCSCTAYANSNISQEGSGCLLWFGNLTDIRLYDQGGQNFYIRMATIEKGSTIHIHDGNATVKKRIGIIVGSVILIAMLLSIVKLRDSTSQAGAHSHVRRVVNDDDDDDNDSTDGDDDDTSSMAVDTPEPKSNGNPANVTASGSTSRETTEDGWTGTGQYFVSSYAAPTQAVLSLAAKYPYIALLPDLLGACKWKDCEKIEGPKILYRAGSWNGLRWTGTPYLGTNSVYTYEFVSNETGLFYTFDIRNISVPERWVMSSSGYLLPSKWKDQNWERFSVTEVDRCELYDVCGSYASCNINNPPDLCECLKGFTPKSPGHGTEGCVRRAPLQCNYSDGFQIHKEVKLPDTSHSRVDNNISLAECKEFCLNNCSCTAYANSDVREGRTGCLLWFDDLFDIIKLELNGQDLYVRVAASELANIDQPIARRRHLSEKKRAIILVSCVVSAVGVLVLGWVIFMGKRKLRIQGKTDNIRDVNNNSEVSETDDTELLMAGDAAVKDDTANKGLDFMERRNRLKGEGCEKKEAKTRNDPHGFPQLVLRNGSALRYRAGSWNVIRFTGALRLNPNPEFLYQFELNKDEQGSLMSRLFMSQPGLIQLLVRSNQSKVWTTVYDAPEDQCDIYSFCGAQAACKTDSSSSVCVCLDGFEPKSPEEWRMSNWSKGCVRMTELNCEKGDEFRNYTGLKLPDTSNSTFNTSMSLQECKEKCLKDCSCTAYANSNISQEGSGCLLWFGNLTDIRLYDQGGQNFYIRMAAIEKGSTIHIHDGNATVKKRIGIIVGSVILIAMLLVGLIFYIHRRKHKKQGAHSHVRRVVNDDDDDNDSTDGDDDDTSSMAVDTPEPDPNQTAIQLM